MIELGSPMLYVAAAVHGSVVALLAALAKSERERGRLREVYHE